MLKVDLVRDQWYCKFNSEKEFEMIFLTLNVFGKVRFKQPIEKTSTGYFFNGYLHYSTKFNKRNLEMNGWTEVSLDYILNYVP